jgi:hypothetical protein
MTRGVLACGACGVVALLGTACTSSQTEKRSSLDVPTSELRANRKIASNGVSAVFDVTLTTTAYESLAISSEEGFAVLVPGAKPTRLTVYDDDRAVGLVESPASFFFLQFVRPYGEERTPIELPPPFSIEAPSQASRSAPLELRWAPNESKPVTVEASAPCLTSRIQRSLAKDRGSYTFPIGDLAVTSGTGTCTITFVVTRSRTAKDETGTTLTEQVRTVTVETRP